MVPRGMRRCRQLLTCGWPFDGHDVGRPAGEVRIAGRPRFITGQAVMETRWQARAAMPLLRPVTSRCRVFGEGCRRLPAAVSLVAVLMGLNLLDVVRLRLPSLDVDVRQLGMPPLVQVSPCRDNASRVVVSTARQIDVADRRSSDQCVSHRGGVARSLQHDSSAV